MDPRRSACCRLGLRSILLMWGLLAAASPGVAGQKRDEWQQPDRVMADLALRPGSAVADVGCGRGYFTFRLARAVGDKGKVFAIDINSDALQPVRERIAREKLTNVEVIVSQPTDTRLQPESCDAALLCGVLHEAPLEDRLPLVRDIARALKPGGYLFLIDWRKSREVTFDPYDKLIPRDDLVKLGTESGLALDAELHYLKFQVALRFRKPPAK